MENHCIQCFLRIVYNKQSGRFSSENANASLFGEDLSIRACGRGGRYDFVYAHIIIGVIAIPISLPKKCFHCPVLIVGHILHGVACCKSNSSEQKEHSNENKCDFNEPGHHCFQIEKEKRLHT